MRAMAMRATGWAAFLLALLFARLAWADGFVVPEQAAVKPARTPDQRALLHHADGVETLVIETTVQGDGRAFAWIVPLPAIPKIEASTRGLFPTLEALCSPRVDTKDHHAWAFVAAAGLVLVLAAHWGGRRPLAAGLLVFGALGVVVTAAVAVSVPKMQESAGDGGEAVAPRVLQREAVGAFDTAVLDARDAKSLRAWLGANGFRATDGIDAVVDDYAARGWIFVASKLRAEAAADGVRAVHPLAFTFASPQPVYPMRLTGAVNETCALELFVFGSMGAAAPALTADFCETRLVDLSHRNGDAYHAELFRRAAGASVVTKLMGTLTTASMADDIEIAWVPARLKQTTYVAAPVALSLASAAGLTALFLALIVLQLRSREGSAQWVRRLATSSAIGVTVGAAVWLALPRLPSNGRVVPRSRYDVRWHERPREAFSDVESARAWARQQTDGVVNPFTGEPVREEDSPGNWVVRDADGVIELALFDADSRYGCAWEWRENLSQPPRRPR